MYVVYGTEAFSETGLFGRLEVIKPAFETIRDDSWKQLVDMAQQRDGPVVLQLSVVTLLEGQYNHTPVPRLRRFPFKQDGGRELNYKCRKSLADSRLDIGPLPLCWLQLSFSVRLLLKLLNYKPRLLLQLPLVAGLRCFVWTVPTALADN